MAMLYLKNGIRILPFAKKDVNLRNIMSLAFIGFSNQDKGKVFLRFFA